MKKLILRFSISKDCLSLYDGHKVQDIFIMLSYIKKFRKKYLNIGTNVFKRSNLSLLTEWSTHNLLYNLHLYRDFVTDVDLQSKEHCENPYTKKEDIANFFIGGGFLLLRIPYFPIRYIMDLIK